MLPQVALARKRTMRNMPLRVALTMHREGLGVCVGAQLRWDLAALPFPRILPFFLFFFLIRLKLKIQLFC